MRAAIAAFTLAMMTACGNGTTPDPQLVEWQGSVQGVPGWEHLSGQGGVVWIPGVQEFATSMQISGDEPGAVRPWHVHHNSCAAGGVIVGDDGDYPRLSIDADGTASVATIVPTGLSTTAPYHINVHLSDDEMTTIIACGDLTPGTGGFQNPGNGLPGY
jgi:superoxide dismutase, Cu-Zn family